MSLILVQEGHRRRGVGRALLAHLEARLRAEGRPLLLSSSAGSESAPQAWHRHVGFREVGIFCGVNEDGSAEVFFAKPLTPRAEGVRGAG